MFGILNSALRVATLSEQQADRGRQASDLESGAGHVIAQPSAKPRFHAGSATTNPARTH
ncbi:MAG: hypothetical protein KJZ59_11165 [Pararhodobacter sp.]|nr:hypothetical protein [Pararhodobacter sp.]